MREVNTPSLPTASPAPSPPRVQGALSSVPRPPRGLRMHTWNGLWGFPICPRSCHLPLSFTQRDLFQGLPLRRFHCPFPT